METFNFAPNGTVPVTLPPDPMSGVSMNGWTFTSRPAVPYQKKFKVVLYGITWFTSSTTGLFDLTTKPTVNARLLELFYERNGVWNPFLWTHPHLGQLTVRFNAPLNVPEGMVDGGGLVDKVEMTFIHHNPGYSSGLS